MHRTNEANLGLITDDLEKLRECFGKWVNLSIESECRVVVTSEDNGFLSIWKREVILGELCESSSKEVAQKISSGKKLKARLCDFRPSFLGGHNGNPEVMISIWEN